MKGDDNLVKKDSMLFCGKIFACGKCLNLGNTRPKDICPLAGVKDMHAIFKESDRVLTF